MRRLAVVIPGVLAVMRVAAPASAFAHDGVTNPYAHATLDVLTLAAVTAPLWTAYLWGNGRRPVLLALVAVVQLPVAVIGFVPIADPVLHAAVLAGGLALTVVSLAYVRRPASSARGTRRSRPAERLRRRGTPGQVPLSVAYAAGGGMSAPDPARRAAPHAPATGRAAPARAAMISATVTEDCRRHRPSEQQRR